MNLHGAWQGTGYQHQHRRVSITRVCKERKKGILRKLKH